MVKVDFLKSIKNNNFFKKYSKPFALLAILIILSIVLFSSYNNYSLENFTSKSNAKIEVMLWTDDNGSLENSFVKNEWLDLVAKYEKYARFGYGSFTEYVTYLNGITKLFGKPYTTKPTEADYTNAKNQLPFVSMVVDIDKDRDFTGIALGGTLTTEIIKTYLFSIINRDYRKLYTNAHISTPTTGAATGGPGTGGPGTGGPATGGPAAPAATAPAATAPSWAKLPGTL